jgi:hypothetical protein
LDPHRSSQKPWPRSLQFGPSIPEAFSSSAAGTLGALTAKSRCDLVWGDFIWGH